MENVRVVAGKLNHVILVLILTKTQRALILKFVFDTLVSSFRQVFKFYQMFSGLFSLFSFNQLLFAHIKAYCKD